MSADHHFEEVLQRNPNVRAERVQAFLRYVERLEAAGIELLPHYRLTHPFAGNRRALQPDSPQSMNGACALANSLLVSRSPRSAP